MGEVYSAWDPQLKREIAIKRVAAAGDAQAEWRDRLLREARSAARITSQHVAALYDVVDEGDELFVVMERVDGETLRHLDLPLATDDFLDVAKQCAAGLAAAHAQGVVHGDIKPHNVMINRAGEVKLLDFGVAGFVDPSGGEAETVADTLAVPPGAAGYTVGYASPEVLKGKPADTRADLFSLGVVFYELLTGVHPFAAENSNAMIGRVLHEHPEPLEERNRAVDPELSRIVTKLLSKDPRARYATADDLLVDLRAARTQHDTGKALGARVRHDAPRMSAGWTGMAIAVALIAVLTSPWWSGILPFGGEQAPATRFDASEWIIAVLPSTAYAEDQRDLRIVNDGLASTLTAGLTRLSQAHRLQVVPASNLFERDALTPEAARREFGVTLALTFDTQRFGDVIRVNANLVDLVARRQVAAETIDGTLEDLLALQERVSQRVLRMLRLELRPMEESYLQAGTTEPRAYNYFVQGVGYFENRTSADDLDAAIDLFEQALRVDPEFAAAHAGLGQALWRRYRATLDPRWVDEAMAACARAVELDEFEAGGHVCLGQLLLGTGQPEQSLASFERATVLDPTRDDAFRGLARAHEEMGRPDLAEQTYRDAIQMRPHYWAGHDELGIFLLRRGRYEEAIESLEEVVALTPDSYAGYSNLGVAYYAAERWTDARRAFERALDLNPDDSRTLSNLGTLDFYQRDFETAARRYERAVELRPRSSVAWGNLGETLVFLEGNSERADAALERALDLVADQLEVNPTDPWPRADQSLYRALQGDGAALETFEQARAGAPDDPEMLFIGAKVAMLTQQPDRALELLEASVAAGQSAKIVDSDPTFAGLAQEPRFIALVSGVEGP